MNPGSILTVVGLASNLVGHRKPAAPTVTAMSEAHKRSYRHPKCKTAYHVRNWAAYEKALRDRGDVTLWLSQEAIDAWPRQRPESPEATALFEHRHRGGVDAQIGVSPCVAPGGRLSRIHLKADGAGSPLSGSHNPVSAESNSTRAQAPRSVAGGAGVPDLLAQVDPGPESFRRGRHLRPGTGLRSCGPAFTGGHNDHTATKGCGPVGRGGHVSDPTRHSHRGGPKRGAVPVETRVGLLPAESRRERVLSLQDDFRRTIEGQERRSTETGGRPGLRGVESDARIGSPSIVSG